MGGKETQPDRAFEFFNQLARRAACKKEFDSLPDQVRATFVTRIKAWTSRQDQPVGHLSPFKESKHKDLYAFKYNWNGDTYRLIFLVHDGLGVGLTAFRKKSTKKKKSTPKSIVDRVEQRHQIYYQGLSPNGTSS